MCCFSITVADQREYASEKALGSQSSGVSGGTNAYTGAAHRKDMVSLLDACSCCNETCHLLEALELAAPSPTWLLPGTILGS